MSVALLACVLCGLGTDVEASRDAAIASGVRFLSREVPLWPQENRCFSCHNNGDAARALMAVGVRREPLAATLDWLADPEAWDRSGREAGPAVDRRLARLQFTAALADALEHGLLLERAPLLRAAGRLAADVRPDGSWPVEDEADPGSPATYGPALATATARLLLRSTDRERFGADIDRSGAWLRARRTRGPLDAAAVVTGLPEGGIERDAALRRLLREQGDDGGWGIFANDPSDSFVTAVSLIALAGVARSDRVEIALQRGEDFLIRTRTAEGSWPEPTRPPAAASYAQRISTTGWAVRALVASQAVRAGGARGDGR